MSAPEGRAAVEERQGPVGVVRHVIHGKVADHEGVHEYAGSYQQAERTCALGIFQPAQFGVFALKKLRRADGGSGERGKKRDEKTDVGGKIHGSS